MNIDIKKVKISVTIPEDNVQAVINAICEEGEGVGDNYTYCSNSVKCIGTFIPSDNANPDIGENKKLEYVEEEKLEVICNIEKVKEVIKKIREIHPYEESTIEIIPLINEEDL